mgnify:CR=1 FL=1
MRDYNYIQKWEKLLTPQIVSLLTTIHEFKGRQALFIEANSDKLMKDAEAQYEKINKE